MSLSIVICWVILFFLLCYHVDMVAVHHHRCPRMLLSFVSMQMHAVEAVWGNGRHRRQRSASRGGRGEKMTSGAHILVNAEEGE